MKPLNLLTLSLLLFFVSANAHAQSTGHVTKRIYNKLSDRYDDLLKDIKDLERQRSALEKSLKDFDLKLKTFKENLEKQEEEFDEALQSDPDQKLAAMRQADAVRMSYNLQYIQLQSQLQNQNGQLTDISYIMKTKLDAAQKIARKSR